MGPSVFWNCPGYFCDSIYLMSGHICYIPFSLELDSRCEVVIPHSKWVGSGRVTWFCRKVAVSRVWEAVGHCIPDPRFLDFAQKSNFATATLVCRGWHTPWSGGEAAVLPETCHQFCLYHDWAPSCLAPHRSCLPLRYWINSSSTARCWHRRSLVKACFSSCRTRSRLTPRRVPIA